MDLSGFMARRYLFSRKSHNIINIISFIAASGIAIGCAAIIIILSVYNGFDSIVRSLYNSYTPDIRITSADGRPFSPSGEKFESIKSMEGVRSVCQVLEENVYLKYDQNQCVALARGVDSAYQITTGLKNYVIEGSFELNYGEMGEVVVGRTIAMEMSIHPRFLTPLEIYFPTRHGEISLVDPLSSLHMETLYPSGIVSLDQDFDKKYIFMPISSLRNLMEYDDQVSSVEIYLSDSQLNRNGIATDRFTDRIRDLLGEDYLVKDKQQQNDTVYKLLKSEKAAIYAILLFVMLIICCNIFSSLSMLIIEKKDDINTLRHMGAEDSLVKKIFVREGWLISLLGIITGTAAGLLICLAQTHFGIVKMPGNFIVDAYPVAVRWSDVAITVGGVALIGYLVAVISRAANYNKEM